MYLIDRAEKDEKPQDIIPKKCLMNHLYSHVPGPLCRLLINVGKELSWHSSQVILLSRKQRWPCM